MLTAIVTIAEEQVPVRGPDSPPPHRWARHKGVVLLLCLLHGPSDTIYTCFLIIVKIPLDSVVTMGNISCPVLVLAGVFQWWLLYFALVQFVKHWRKIYFLSFFVSPFPSVNISMCHCEQLIYVFVFMETNHHESAWFCSSVGSMILWQVCTLSHQKEIKWNEIKWGQLQHLHILMSRPLHQ